MIRNFVLVFVIAASMNFGFSGASVLLAADTVTASQSTEATPSSLASFKRNLISVAEKACRDGEITRAQLFKIRLLAINKRALAEAHSVVADQLTSEGQVNSAMSIDWDKFLAVLKEWLPVILDLIKFLAQSDRPLVDRPGIVFVQGLLPPTRYEFAVAA